MQQQILVPLDGSALAESILPYAGALARATASRLKLLKVKPPPLVDMGGNGMTSILENWQKQALDAAHTYLTGVAARLQSAGLVVQTEVLEGDPVESIGTGRTGLVRGSCRFHSLVRLFQEGNEGEY